MKLDYMYCTECGENPNTEPEWSGSENWFDGFCNTCNNKNAEFVLDADTPEQKANTSIEIGV